MKFVLILDFCSTIDCLNGGFCEEDDSGPNCVCLRGFTGQKCEGQLIFGFVH